VEKFKSLLDKTNNYISKNKLIYLSAIAIVFIICIPFMQKGFIISEDWEYHMARIQSITDSLKLGIFPVKIHHSMATTYGYASGIFYPNLFLYFPAILNMITSNIIISYYIFIAVMLFIMFTIVYKSLLSVTDDRKISILGTALIMLSKALILNLHDRFALGEFLGYIFITPIIAGLYNYVHKDFNKPYLLVIGFLGVLNTHIITTFICTAFSILYFIINIKSTIKNPKKLLKLFLCIIIVLAMSIAFWAPLIEQYFVQDLKLTEPWTDIAEDTYTVVELLGIHKYSIGIVITMCIPFIMYALFDKNISNKNGMKQMAILGLIIMSLMPLNVFWDYTQAVTNTIQFKWRLIGISTIVLIIPTIMFIKEYAENNKIKVDYIIIPILIVTYIVAIINIYSVSHGKPTVKLDYLNTILNKTDASLGGGKEYLPLETRLSYLLFPNTVKTDIGTEYLIEKSGLSCKFYIPENLNIKAVDVPFIYYKGYTANITTKDNQIIPLNLYKDETTGIVKVFIPDGLSGEVSVWYNRTIIQETSYIISFFSDIGIVGFYILYKIKNKKKLLT